MVVVAGLGLADCLGVGGSGVGWSCCDLVGGSGCVVAVLCWTGGAALRDGMPVTKGGSLVVMAQPSLCVLLHHRRHNGCLAGHHR